MLPSSQAKKLNDNFGLVSISIKSSFRSVLCPALPDTGKADVVNIAEIHEESYTEWHINNYFEGLGTKNGKDRTKAFSIMLSATKHLRKCFCYSVHCVHWEKESMFV
jgi:hypothetical protein